ncbi:hypothetical protein [Pseudaminobacter soli (ex Li et al. 2025)]|uniref:Uncharacterized protein n=1 Tax=Pseudaminobacter soli (ex Li et al. 2025) TaxID=1295366 RepID=A0A2P7RZZ5_9HYPH|nr:hypothetical protein [Mesorhizobium soli]PSJ55790.1 hypothetical protein C7I85_26240 [Mesorhizobium soli]
MSPAIWRSKRFLGLKTDRGRLLLFYYLTCRHQNSSGAYRLPEGYAVADLGWPLDEYRAGRSELLGAGMIHYDDETEEIYVSGWFKACPPMNDKHAAGTMSRISEIESDALREVVELEFTAVNKTRLVDQIKRRGPGNAHFDANGFDANH